MPAADPIISVQQDFIGAIARGVRWLRDGGILGVPTESVYGLAVCADNAAAVARLRALKGRDAHKPLPLVAQTLEAAERHGVVPNACRPLVAHFWPGPLTLGLVPRGPWPDGIVSRDGTMGVRVSAHPVLQALCRGVDGLITATSANFAGDTPVHDVRQAPRALLEQALWLDGGVLPAGPPSTVVVPLPPPSAERLRVARLGAICEQQLVDVLGAHVLV